MNKIVVTSGKKYIDIDAYAGCIAYSGLLNSLGHNSISYSSAIPNESICDVILELGFTLDEYNKDESEIFIILDVSNPDMFDNIVDNNKIIEIIDHHTGYEQYWKEKNINANIEFIGSVCTIIFEKYLENNKLNLLDNKLCKLLISGILDNTLNLKASITTKRDIDAYNKLMEIGKVDESWTEEYFLSCQKKIEEDLETSIINDLKIEYINELLPEVFGQLLIYDINPILNNKTIIDNTLNKYSNEWIINLISIKEGKSYIYINGNNTKKNIEILFGTNIKDNILILDKFMLRKEIIKLAREKGKE